jgi:hypothetical protein
MAAMLVAKLISVHYLCIGRERVPIVLTHNEGGTVAGECLLGDEERPIIDGPSVQVVLAVIQDALEVLLLARKWGQARR